MSVQKITYLLACLHYAQGPETLVSGMLYCPWDKDLSQIIKVEEMEWRANCTSCKFARWAGMSKPNAETFAVGHLRHNPGHQVECEYVIHPAAEASRIRFEAFHGDVFKKITTWPPK